MRDVAVGRLASSRPNPLTPPNFQDDDDAATTANTATTVASRQSPMSFSLSEMVIRRQPRCCVGGVGIWLLLLMFELTSLLFVTKKEAGGSCRVDWQANKRTSEREQQRPSCFGIMSVHPRPFELCTRSSGA